MRSFRAEFNEYFEDGVITMIELGLGPCGELRYPSSPVKHGWRYPGIGAFQVFYIWPLIAPSVLVALVVSLYCKERSMSSNILPEGFKWYFVLYIACKGFVFLHLVHEMITSLLKLSPLFYLYPGFDFAMLLELETQSLPVFPPTAPWNHMQNLSQEIDLILSLAWSVMISICWKAWERQLRQGDRTFGLGDQIMQVPIIHSHKRLVSFVKEVITTAIMEGFSLVGTPRCWWIMVIESSLWQN